MRARPLKSSLSLMGRLGLASLFFLLFSLSLLSPAHSQIIAKEYSVRNSFVIRGGTVATASSLDLSDKGATASFTLDFPYPLYFQTDRCAKPSSCPGHSVLPCCRQCLNGAPVGQTNCVCSTERCLDAKTKPLTLELDQGEEQYFEFGIQGIPCQNLIVMVQTITGDQDLYLSAKTFPRYVNDRSDTYEWYSEMYLSDSFVMCNQQGDGLAAANSDWYAGYHGIPLWQNSTDVYTRFYLTVFGWNQGSYRIFIREATMDKPFFLLPIDTFYFMAPDLVNLRCNGTLLRGSGVPPTTDPAFIRYAASSGIAVLNGTLPLNLFAFYLDVWRQTNGQLSTYFDGDLNDCHITVSNFRDENGYPYPPVAIDFPVVDPPCEFEALTEAVTGFTNVIAALDNVTDFPDLATKLTEGGAWSISNAWAGCLSFLANNLTSTTLVPTQANSTTACFAERGTTEFAIDPCCNQTLAFTQCCLPKNVPYQQEVNDVNLDTIRRSCSTPACTVGTARDYVNIANVGADFSAGCDAASADRLSDPRLTNDLVEPCVTLFASGVFCSDDSSCPYGTLCRGGTCNFPTDDVPLIQCIIDTMYPPFASEFKAMLGLTPSAPDAQFEVVFRSHYQKTGCVQPYYVDIHPQNARQGIDRNASLDMNQQLCLETDAFCNWAPTTKSMTLEQCQKLDWRGQFFCASSCALYGRGCQEVSSMPGCFYNYPGLARGAQIRCEAAGGMYSPNDTSSRECWFATLNSQDSCVLPSRCPAPYFSAADNSISCPEYCLLAQITNATQCTCANFPASLRRLCDAYGVEWGTQPTPGCRLKSIQGGSRLLGDCPALNGTYWRGAVWYPGKFTTENVCEDAGTCSNPSGMTQADCATLNTCSADVRITDPVSCSQSGSCSNEYYTQFGSCVFPYSVDSTTGTPFCEDGLTFDPAGCLNYFLLSSKRCVNLGGTWYLPSKNQSACLSYTGCKQTQFTVLSPKTGSACTGCNGTIQPLYTWYQGVWQPASWQSYTWQPRQWLPANSWGPLFDRDSFQVDLDRLYYRLLAQIAKADLLCRLSLVSCDCGGGSNCYAVPVPSFLGLTNVCGGKYASFSPAAPVTGETPVTVIVNPDVQFTTGCADVQLSTLPMKTFNRPVVTLYSSLFLASIKDDPYSILRNSHGYAIGQLRGDVLTLEIADAQAGTQIPKGNFTLCMVMRQLTPDVGRFKVYDFAVSAPDFAVESFTPRFVETWLSTQESDQLLCTLVTEEGIYAPITRSERPESVRYRDTLTDSQVNAFFVAGAIYLVLLIICLWRVINLFLFTYLKKGDVVARTVLLLPKTVLSVLAFFLFLRMLLFFLIPSGAMNRAPVIINLLMAELPTGLYFTVFTLMVIWWVELYHRSTNLQKGFLGQSKNAFIVINVVVYLFLLIVIIIFAVKGKSSKSVKPCADAPDKTDKTATVVAKVYKVFISVLSFIIALGFIVYGLRLIALLGKMTQDVRTSLVKFTIVSITCSLGLITECALLLYGAFGSNSLSSVVALILLLIVEVIPALALVATMKQPPNPAAPEGLLGDTFWFCYAEATYFGMGSAGSGQRTSARNSSRHSERQDQSLTASASTMTKSTAPLPPSRSPSGRDHVVEDAEMRLSSNKLRDDSDEEKGSVKEKKGRGSRAPTGTAEAKLDSPFFEDDN